MEVTIENPILNSPFHEPTKHFLFDSGGITNEIATSRRPSSFFIPIAGAKRSNSGKTAFETEWTRDRLEENEFINQVRGRLAVWRQSGYLGTTSTSKQLINYWSDESREKKLFFCQIEALETVIYLTEAAAALGDGWMLNHLKEASEIANPGLHRIAFKMATGSGKTVVMGMLIAWHALNKHANPTDKRFSDTFLLVAPGITIRDRLRVLLPNEDDNYYRQRDLVPPVMFDNLQRAQIHITNFHAFQLRDKLKVSKVAKAVLGTDGLETPDEMVRRVCRSLKGRRNIVVINDEAHHCYMRKPDDFALSLDAEERVEAKQREEEAKVWISGLEAIRRKLGIREIYDLSATPFFLKGSGYPEGTLFPWVVSDFSLIDAIEAGIVKIPRVPVSDDSGVSEQPTYRELWPHVKDQLPKKGRTSGAEQEEPILPTELQAALHSLYGNYKKYFRAWQESDAGAGATAPVFIVVCNNTQVSKMVFDYISGWEREIDGQKVVQAGKLEEFRNDNGEGGWKSSPWSILVDSTQLESGEALSDEFKKLASREIDEFKSKIIARTGGRSLDSISDSEILREVLNTVGKPGKLGEGVRCVVSVSMLTEGWDANTVTHVLGVRAFSTQLLCEQVVGRALRRRSYVTNEIGHFEPEYAEVYGVPFSFIPTNGSVGALAEVRIPTRVRSLPERASLNITFPKVLGYRFDFGTDQLNFKFTKESNLELSTEDVPIVTENAPIVGEKSIHNLDDLRLHRENEVVFAIAKEVLERYFRDLDGNLKPWLFPRILEISKEWFADCLKLKDKAFVQLLLLNRLGLVASEKIYRSIVAATDESVRLRPIIRANDSHGDTSNVDFDTIKPVMTTRADKSPISHVVADTKSWEQQVASTLENMPEVVSYAKNQNVGLTVPYTYQGESKQYYPDFLVKLSLENGDVVNLIAEVSGENRADKAAKVETCKTLWVPAVNNQKTFGRWAFIELRDPWNAETEIRSLMKELSKVSVEEKL